MVVVPHQGGCEEHSGGGCTTSTMVVARILATRDADSMEMGRSSVAGEADSMGTRAAG
jgi:hypothetical protein